MIRIPALATQPPQESLRNYFPKYINLARENQVESIKVSVGQLSFTYDVQTGQMRDFDVDEFSKKAGVNVELMRQKTQEVLDSLR